ncbi:hypothetical protein FNF29_05619 [Cafeteria roenbergensis]|uniref:Orotidine 5'-phosphate decarboxylase n=1 Tax=Cafeteria roenbergensis TaxID=33653 RepID=A0A5A8CBJ0_CAFRO|nr:hypothetical protein FNF29_05619 [Cafeteria roenbergensis]KAA0158271.1 hypothetical protein FNF28_06327 [Cafeteria roenbergensis]|eukprot:KAA0149999.1 hypothetical protein FNF29_05619 [Cafeteria roenbergensis]
MAASTEAAPTAPGAEAFFARLEARCREINSVLCVGLDPHGADLAPKTAEGALEFCKRIAAAAAPVAAAYKPNAAFFEAFGAPGWAALKSLVAFLQAELGGIVVLDCKRGDIGSTSDAYAEACFCDLGADAVTLHGYMGADSVDPFAASGKPEAAGARPAAARGAFVLCKTSNPSSSEVQSLPLAAGAAGAATTVFEAVALSSAKWGCGSANVGLVVGATDLDALRRVRRLRPDVWILAPGVGAQGASAADVAAAAVRPDGLGVLVPVSRGISRAEDPAAAARSLCSELNEAREAAAAAAGAAGAAAAAEAASAPAAGGGVAVAGSPSLAPHQLSFLRTAIAEGVLRFGSFTLKSGRSSPYFFNAGRFVRGSAVAAVGAAYARAVIDSGLEFDVVFGPAYKGIPLATAVGMSLAAAGADTAVAYNRKEAKDHGEGGLLVGADVAGKRVLLVDDVMSSGKAVLEAAEVLSAAGATLAGVVVGLDRQERRSATDARPSTAFVAEELGIRVVSVARLDDLITLLEAAADPATAEHLPAMAAYRDEWGVRSA